MNDSSGMDSTTAPGVRGSHPALAAAPPTWREALGTLVAARIALLEFESKAAARQAGKCLAKLAAAAFATFFAWALGLAGGIAACAAATSWPWYWIALVAAALHGIAASIWLQLAKSVSPAAFPMTRAEFQKDREWLETLKSPRKSND
jgi:uncharacterized membrane protein YqjE